MPAYVPARGDLIWLQFDPQAGHEQAGHRPAVIISPSSYNHRVGLALCCPVTSQVKGYPFQRLAQRVEILDAAPGFWSTTGRRGIASANEMSRTADSMSFAEKALRDYAAGKTTRL